MSQTVRMPVVPGASTSRWASQSRTPISRAARKAATVVRKKAPETGPSASSENTGNRAAKAMKKRMVNATP